MPRSTPSKSDLVKQLESEPLEMGLVVAGPSLADQQLQTAINELRLVYNLPPMTFDSRLSAVAQGHSRYLNRNSVTTVARWHVQRPEDGFFTGETLAKRLDRFGAGQGRAYVLEGVLRRSVSQLPSTVQDETAQDSNRSRSQGQYLVRQMLGSPKHRSVILAPSNQSFGIGRSGPFRVLLSYAPRWNMSGNGEQTSSNDFANSEAVGFPRCGVNSKSGVTHAKNGQTMSLLKSGDCQSHSDGDYPKFTVHLSKRFMNREGLAIELQVVGPNGDLTKVPGQTKRGAFGDGRLGPTDLLFVPDGKPTSFGMGSLQLTLKDSTSGEIFLEWHYSVR